MVTRTVIIDTEEHAREFDSLIRQLGYVKQIRQLKAEDVALGIGAPYTEEELNAFLKEDESDKTSIDLITAIEDIKRKLGDS